MNWSKSGPKNEARFLKGLEVLIAENTLCFSCLVAECESYPESAQPEMKTNDDGHEFKFLIQK